MSTGKLYTHDEIERLLDEMIVEVRREVSAPRTRRAKRIGEGREMKTAHEIIAARISLDCGTIVSDACGNEIAATDILADLAEAGFILIEPAPQTPRAPQSPQE